MSDELEPIEDDVPARELEEMPRLAKTMASENFFKPEPIEGKAMLPGFTIDGTDIDPLPIEGIPELFARPWFGGEQHMVCFPNGFGASIIRHDGSYGGEKGLWELAVVEMHGPFDWGITYDTPITNDVLGWLGIQQVAELLLRISRL